MYCEIMAGDTQMVKNNNTLIVAFEELANMFL